MVDSPVVLKYFEGTTDGNRQNSISVAAYATLRKTGPGTFSPSTGPIPNIRVEEGTMGYIGYAATIISENQGNLTAGNGVLLKGGNFIQPNSVRLGSATPEGPDGKKTFTVGPGGCAVDLLGGKLTRNYEWENGVVANASFFRGQDTIEIMSSVAGAKLDPNAYRDDNFEGTFKLNVPCISCVAVPRAEWRICKDVTNDFIGVFTNYSDLRFGCLTGEGHLNVKSAQTYLPGYLYIGRDRDETKYFDGSFCITYGDGSCGSMQLIKVGSNAWGPRGGANRMDCPAVVREGALLVANDSPSLDLREGALSVTGDLTIAEGTTLTIDDSVCTKENRANEYVLVSVTGGITGRYALTNTLPFGWRISYRGKNIVLRYDAGGTVLYIR